MEGTLVRVACEKDMWQDRRPADRDVTHRGVAGRLSVLISLLIGMRITRNGISEPQISSAAEGVQPSRCTLCVSPEKDVSRKRGVSIGSAYSRSDGISTAGTGGAVGAWVAAIDRVDRGRRTGGGVLAFRANGRGAPPSRNS